MHINGTANHLMPLPDHEHPLILFSQKRFFIANESEDSPTTWWIPITYTKRNNSDFDTTAPSEWLKGEQDKHIHAGLGEDEWFILNIQETGMTLKIYMPLLMCVCVCCYW
jgi:hypothetical protein